MNLKNLLIMAAMSVMTFGFAACSSDDDDDKDGMLYDDVNSEYNDYVSVCGIKWARGNLQHLGEDWRIADHQWEYFKVGSINSIFYFLHKTAEPFNCLEQDNLA